MQLLLNKTDNTLFLLSSLTYNIINIITKNTIIYSFIFTYIQYQQNNKIKPIINQYQNNPLYNTIIYLCISLLITWLLTKAYLPLYKRQKAYIKEKTSYYIRDMYMHAVVDKYLTQKSMTDLYDVFYSFMKYIDDYSRLYEIHSEIIIASIVIAISYKSYDVNKIMALTSAIIITCLFILEYLLKDNFNELHEYFITSVINEKLLLIFLIYIPYKFTTNTDINTNTLNKINKISTSSEVYGSLIAIFIILFWQISFQGFINEYTQKIALTHKVQQFILKEQKELTNAIYELSAKHNHFIYLIHDSNEPISIVDYFKLTNPNISESKIIFALNQLSILPELHKKLHTHMNDESLTYEQKIKISIARSLIIPPNYTVIHFKGDEIVNKYKQIIKNSQIAIIGNLHALS